MEEDGKMKCPCKICKNLNLLSIDVVIFHFLFKGTLKGYTMWMSHGEVVERNDSQKSHRRRHHRKHSSINMYEKALYVYYQYNAGSE